MPSLQGYDFTGPAPTLDEADQLWRGLCLEREAAHREVSECLREIKSGSVESFKRLKRARNQAKTIQYVMLRFLDVLDRAQISCERFVAADALPQVDSWARS